MCSINKLTSLTNLRYISTLSVPISSVLLITSCPLIWTFFLFNIFCARGFINLLH